jgi:hypothetical protein
MRNAKEQSNVIFATMRANNKAYYNSSYVRMVQVREQDIIVMILSR